MPDAGARTDDGGLSPVAAVGCAARAGPGTGRTQHRPEPGTGRTRNVIIMSAHTLPGDTHDAFPAGGDRPIRQHRTRAGCRHSGLQRGNRPAPGGAAGCTSTCPRSVPLTFRITIADNASTDGTAAIADQLAVELARRPRRSSAREGPRPGAQDGLVRVGRRGAGLHGRRSLHRSRRAAAAGRAADLRSFRHRDRHPAAPRIPGDPRTQAGVHLPLLQPDPARRAGRAFLRRAMRLQGDPRPTWRSNCCRWCRTPGGSSTPSC